MVHLSAPILTRPQIPAFTGSIEVAITTDLPWPNAEFAKCYPSAVHLYNYVCLVNYCPL